MLNIYLQIKHKNNLVTNNQNTSIMVRVRSIIWSFVLVINFIGYSQSPGGVPGSQVWFKTNQLPNGYFNWQDFSGNGVKFNDWNSTKEYTYTNRNFNFNTGLYMNGWSSEFFLNQTNLQQATIIGIFGFVTTNFNYETTIFGVKGRPNESTLITNDKIVDSAERGSEILDYGEANGEDLYRKQDNSEGSEAKFRERSLKIVSYYQYQQPNISVWGEDQNSSITLGNVHINEPNGFSTYTMKNFYNNLYGYLPELFVYSRILTLLERRKAETYLAVKYGVSLTNSYIASDDKLIWDYSANTAYNNRITGIMRDDASGLNQPFSTTSYEEGPYYSDSYDSYQDPAYRDQSTRYRLLAMGQMPANELADKNAALWGDDNGILATKDAGGIAGIKRMARTWKLVTNIPNPTAEQKKLLFNSKGFEVDSNLGKSTFTSDYAYVEGISVTKTPTQKKNGYLEFKTVAKGSDVTVKFGAQNGLAGPMDYGIKMDANGSIYAIENTKQPVYLGVIIPNYHKTTIEKKGNQVFINIYDPNGVKSITTRILTVLPADLDKDFYGVVSSVNKTVDFSLTVLHGGFIATGSRVELSYDSSRAAEFANYTDRSYLIIDRSGTGEFGVDNVEYLPISEIDNTRKKIIFNNVLWDTDGNGKDVFSFGYKDKAVKLIAVEEAIPPTCVDGVLQQDGKINIEVKEGFPAYKYTLNKTGTSTVLQTGTFNEPKKTLTNLEAGNYDLTLEMVGTNFERSGGSSFAMVASVTNTSLITSGNGSLEWTVSDIFDYVYEDKYIGFIDQKTILTRDALSYGVHIEVGGRLSFFSRGGTYNVVLATLSKGDRIKLEMQNDILKCSVNGSLVGTTNLYQSEVGKPYFGFIGFEGTSNGIYNLTHTGFVNSSTKLGWSTATYLTITEGDGIASKVVQKIEIKAPECKEILPPVTPPVTDNLVVAPVPSKAGANFNIYVKLNNPSEMMVLIFNTAGTLITQLRNPELQKTGTFTTSIPTSGIYIIKVLTTEGEFSKSIIIQ